MKMTSLRGAMLAAATLFASQTQAATVTIFGNFQRNADANISAIDLSFSQSFEVDDALINSGQGTPGGTPLDLVSNDSFSIGTTTFDSNNMKISLYSTASQGIIFHLNGFADNSANLSFGQNDFRIYGQTGAGFAISDALTAPQTVGSNSFVFTTASGGFSQTALTGSATVSVAVAAVPLPATATLLSFGLAALGWGKRRAAKGG